MKKSILLRMFGTVFLIMTIAIVSASSSSAKSSEHPPGICMLYMPDNSLDLQPASDLQLGLHAFGLLPDAQWSPERNCIGFANPRAGKALPKAARQRLYGISEYPHFDQRLC